MRKVLPVTNKPYIMTYSYYAYPQSILGSDFYIGKVAAEIEMPDYHKYDWISDHGNLTLYEEGEKIRFEAEEFNTDMYYALCRDVAEIDEIEITIYYQQYSQPWGAINLFLADNLIEEINQDDKYLCRIGYFPNKGVYLRVNNLEQELNMQYMKFPIRIKLKKLKESIQFFVFDKEWKNVSEFTMDANKESNLKIGVQVKLNDNAYYNWLFMNHIQLSLDKYDDNCKLCYFYGITKNWEYYTVNYFIDYNVIDLYEYQKFGVDILSFVKMNLDRGKYIEMFLNQYYIEGRDEYQKVEFYHQTLIYGYDDEMETLFIMGYSSNGNIIVTEYSYKNFLDNNIRGYAMSHMAVMKYYQDGHTYEFSLKYCAEMLKQYLEGINSSIYYSNLVPADNRIYGIRLYDELNSDRGIKIITRDRRITHLLYEHKVCMKDRIRFLYIRRILNEEQYRELDGKMDEITHIALNLRNLALKYAIAQNDLLVMKMKEKIIMLRDLERTCLSLLYQLMEQKLMETEGEMKE